MVSPLSRCGTYITLINKEKESAAARLQRSCFAMNEITIRFAQKQDAQALLAIYAPYVENTSITFEYEVPSPEEFASRIEEISSFYPYLVCEHEGEILGYAYAHRFKERAAYQWGAELSIYLAPKARGQKIGPRLYDVLMQLLTLQNFRNFYACITSPNERSQKMHEALGFTLCGLWHHSGYKHGAWHDVAWYEKAAGCITDAPKQLISLHDLDSAAVADIIHT